MIGGGGAPLHFHRRRLRDFSVGGGGVDGVRALKQRTLKAAGFCSQGQTAD